MPHFSIKNASLVNILQNRELFDYCNLSVYTPSGITPLLGFYNLTINSTWMAYAAETSIVPYCQPQSERDKYILFWENIWGVYIQNMGAVGYIHSYPYDHYSVLNHLTFIMSIIKLERYLVSR